MQKPKKFTANGKVVKCGCGNTSLIPFEAGVRIIAGIRRDFLKFKCPKCPSITTETKIWEPQLIPLDKDND